MTRLQRAGRTPALFVSFAIVAVAAVVLALSLTGGSDAAAPSPRSAAPVAPAARAAAPVGSKASKAAPAQQSARPGDSPAQMYLTDTDERRGELIHAWDVCLLDHGASQDTSRAAAVFQGTGKTPLVVADPVPAAASAACEDKLPLLPKEENPALNPNYVADSAANVACLRAKGVDVHTVPDNSVFPDGLSWTFDTSTTKTLPNEGAVEKACEVQAFSAG